MDRLGEVTACYTMRFERTSKHPPGRLWHAITDPAELMAWWQAPSARVDLRVGGEYFVEFATEEAGNLDGTIVACDPERHLLYAWGVSLVEWTIEPDGDGSRFRFTHHGQPPGQVPLEGGIAAGYHVGFDYLEAQLDGLARERSTEEWREAGEVYTELINRAIGHA